MESAYGSYKKRYIFSPWTETNVKRFVRKNYKALSTSLLKSGRTQNQIITQVINIIKNELKKICSLSHHSILRDSHEAVKNFSWETVWLELSYAIASIFSLKIPYALSF